MTDNSETITDPGLHRGPVAWMVHNRVTPNLLMLFLLVGGFFMAFKIKKEVFPEFTLDTITIRVPYPGASPEEVEQGIILAIEEGVRGLEGVKEVSATAAENIATLHIELTSDANVQKVYQDIQQEVDRITTIPEEAEEPVITLDVRRRDVVTLQLYGDVSEWALRNTAEDVRDRLLQGGKVEYDGMKKVGVAVLRFLGLWAAPTISQVDLIGERNFEVHVEIPPEKLRAYGLTLDQVARQIRATAVELPGGGVKTSSGEILMRFKERRDWAAEFARLPVVTTREGAVLHLGDIGRVYDGFVDTDRSATYNGKPAIGLEVYRVGQETPIGVSDAVTAAMAAIEADLPEGIHYTVSRDWSDIYRQRQELLLKNAFFGIILVMVLLGVFLEFKLAFWVMMGIPTSFLGAMMFLPGLNVSINMISMFAFIIALGIVVDDAIVAGENIYEYRQQGLSFFEAAVKGARDVSSPVAFSILTNIVAFIPLYFIPGFLGKIWVVIPTVVIATFLISWFECMFILPAHLAHTSSKPLSRFTLTMHNAQQAFSRFFMWCVQRIYGPILERVVRARYVTVAAAAAVFVITIGYVASGRINLILMPRTEADQAVVSATLPVGSPLANVEAVRDRLVAAADRVIARKGGDRLSKGIFTSINENRVEIIVYLTDANTRPINTGVLTQLWRDEVGQVPGVESVQFVADRGGPGSGAALTVELSHRDINVLDRASAALAERLAEFPNVKDIDDGYTPGKAQLNFQLKPEGRSLGLTSQEVARQVRHAFYGAEAIRQQRGRSEVKVMVRTPECQRVSEYDIEQLMIRTPAGTDVPLRQVAEVARGRAYTTITRRDGRRTVQVSGDVEPIGETGKVIDTLNASVLPELLRDYPGLTCGYEGSQADMRESMGNLKVGFLMALVGIYFLLAIPFRSYAQPLIVMTAIPFGIIGAVLGHILMGYDLSVMSMMGIVALAGVVVNDSLVLIDFTNIQRTNGMNAHDAVCSAGIRRFRPILLTTLTTFGGLAPMIFETSRQARFMIPMAISLGFGILFATFISLLLVPCLYMILEDVIGFFRSTRTTGCAAQAVSNKVL
jgi:multidrug efflux pump subunit AcrB